MKNIFLVHVSYKDTLLSEIISFKTLYTEKLRFKFHNFAFINVVSNMLIYSFRASYPNVDLISSVDFYLGDVGKNYHHYKSMGFFKKLEEKAIFIYEIIAHGQRYIGIVAANDVQDIAQKNILGHEHTIIEKEQEMLSKMLHRKAMIKPVLLGYHGDEHVSRFIDAHLDQNLPILDMQAKLLKERHRIWALTSQDDINEIKQLFKLYVPKAYIADGHHRSKVTSELLKKSFLHDEDGTKHPALLAAFFNVQDLTIYDFNRVVELPESMTLLQFIIKCSGIVDIKQIAKPEKPTSKYTIHIFIEQCWYAMTWKESVLEKYTQRPVVLDVDIFNHEILEGILDIDDVKTATCISYVPGHMGLQPLIDKCKSRKSVAFSFFPIQNQDVIKISDQGDVLPPKSTWFEPRMHNGMLIKEF